jgi:hypothetical protein
MMYDFSFACQIVARRNEVVPPYTNREIRDIMYHPMTLGEIFNSREARIKNLTYYLLGILPPAISVGLISRLGRKYMKEPKF